MRTDHWPEWRGPPRWPEGDAGRRGPRPRLAVLIGAIQVIGVGIAAPDGVDGLAWALLVIGPAALLLRWRWPLLAYGITVLVTLAYLVADYPRGPFFLAAVVALFNAVRRSRRRGAWALTVLGYAAYVAICGPPGSAIYIGDRSLADPDIGRYMAVAAWTAVALVLAEANRVRSEAFAQMAKAGAEAARAKQEQKRRQASDERLRIARELHDVLGHHLSLINVRAGVALHLLDTDQRQARESLRAIKLASAEALREVRGVLAALNPNGEAAPRSPAPGLADVEDLVADARAAGLDVTLTDTSAEAIPGEVGRAAYRIVQEALTNVRRHAGSSVSVTVRLADDSGSLLVDVTDTGTGLPASIMEGNGIPSMRERARALGGTLKAGPGPGGGFRVAARMPYPTPERASGSEEET